MLGIIILVVKFVISQKKIIVTSIIKSDKICHMPGEKSGNSGILAIISKQKKNPEGKHDKISECLGESFLPTRVVFVRNSLHLNIL